MGPAHGKDSLGTFESAVEAAVAVARRYGQPQEPQEEAGQSQQEELCAEYIYELAIGSRGLASVGEGTTAAKGPRAKL